jgi:acetylornithine deacetylase/succinyl-diaminopimelate desuccinylase-like protein
MPKPADIERNAEHPKKMLIAAASRSRPSRPARDPPAGLATQIPGAKRTLVLYAHFDASRSRQGPALRPLETGDPTGAVAGKTVDLAQSKGPLDPEWRIYGRSASDDKGPIVAMLAALDALKTAGVQPSVNLKLFLEGEEEQGSPHLTRILTRYKDLLAADAWILCDGPVHPTRKMQVYFGARGVTAEMMVYGPDAPSTATMATGRPTRP